jgi:hypothetical protein
MNIELLPLGQALAIFAIADPDLCFFRRDLKRKSYAITIPEADDSPTFYVCESDLRPVALAWLDRAVVFAARRRSWSISAYLQNTDGTFNASFWNLHWPGDEPPEGLERIECKSPEMAIARLNTYAIVYQLCVKAPIANVSVQPSARRVPT